MRGVEGLAGIIRRAREKHSNGGMAMRGIIRNDRVCIGGRSYPFSVAVECHTEEGSIVWVQLTKNGEAVVVGS